MSAYIIAVVFPAFRRRALRTMIFCAASALLLLGSLPAWAQQSAFANYLGTITTVAGTGTAGYKGTGTASQAPLNNPSGVGYDAAGNLYILDKGKSSVQEVFAPINSSSQIQTVVGTGTAGVAVNGVKGTATQMNTPNALYVDPVGNIYITDTNNNLVRKYYANVAANGANAGMIFTVIGMGATGASTDTGDGGPATSATIGGPNGVAVDVYGNIYAADSSHQVLRVVYEAGPVSAIPGLAAGLAAVGQTAPVVGDIYTVAGVLNANTSTGDGGPATIATVGGPRFVSLDSHDDVYLTDRTHFNIREINGDTDNINTVAGNSTQGGTGDGGAATQASLNQENATFQDLLGNIYIVDTTTDAIRVVDAQTGKIYTIAGQDNMAAASFAADGDGGLSTAAYLNGPLGVALSPTGAIAIADGGLHAVRQVSAPVTSYAATAVGSSSASTTYTVGLVTADTINSIALTPAAPADFTISPPGCTLPSTLPAGTTTCTPAVKFTPTAPGLRTAEVVTTDSGGNRALLGITGVANAAAVSITPGLVSTIAGTPGTPGSTGDGGAAIAATLTAPSGIALDASGNLYIAGADNKVRVRSAAGTISTLAGTGTAGFSGDGGAAAAAQLNNPSAVAVDPTGNVYIADTGNNVVRAVGAEGGVIRSLSAVSLLSGPKGVATDATGNLFIADTGNDVVREVSRFTGQYTIVAGTPGTAGKSGDSGAAASALLNGPTSLALDAAGNLYISDTGNNEVRKVTFANGAFTTIATVAGSGTAGSTGDGGPATAATLNAPAQIAVDAAGDIFIAGSGSNKVRFVNASTGIITTIAGTGTAGFSGDGGLATATTLNGPQSLAIDGKNNLYVADTGNSRIASIPGTTTTLTFPKTDTGKSSTAIAATVTNFGNATLTLSGLTVSSSYSQVASGGTDCTATTMLPAGASCLISVIFTPTGSGTIPGSVILTDNALNGTVPTQMITLTGIGNNTSVPASVSATAGNNQTTTPYSSFSANLQATVVDQNGFGVAGASVTFTAPSSGTTCTFSNGTNTITVTSAGGGVASVACTAGATRGAFSVTATVSGVSAPATFSETIAGNPSPGISLAYSPTTNPATYGGSVTLTATLTQPPTATAAIGGTVTFYDNGPGNPVQTVSVKSNTATYTYVPGAGSHSYTATFNGDGNYASSSTIGASVLSISPLAITATANSVSFTYGATTLPTITGKLNGVLPADTANVTVSFTSAGLSATANTGTYPITGNLSGSAAGNYTLTSTSGTVTVTPAPVVITLTASNPTPGTGTVVTLIANVVSTVTNVAVGGVTVSFFDGTTALGSSPTGNGGSSSKTATFTTLGNHVITANVTPGNYGPATSNAVTVVVSNPGLTFAFTSGASSTVVQGQKAVVPFTLTTIGGITTTVTFTCSGLPANASCGFSPTSFTPTPAASPGVYSTTGEVEIFTSGPGVIKTSLRTQTEIWFAGLCALPVAFFVFLHRRRRPVPALLLLLLGAALLATSGCGGGVSNPAQAVYTPTGTSTISVTATTGTLSTTQTITLNVVASSN